MKRLLISLLVLAVAMISCNLPQALTPTLPDSQCAYVEARQPLPELSKQFLESLKGAALPVEQARAEAYGENCVAADNTVVRFAAMETDFYVTLNVSDPSNETAMGRQLGQVLDIIDRVPRAETGPNPGYIGVTFKATGQTERLWFTQTKADDLRAQGLKDADLYRALKATP